MSRAIVHAVVVPVAIVVELAGIADIVGVAVFLLRVRIIGTVITKITDTIPIGVDLDLVCPFRAVVAGVAEEVPIAIFLSGIYLTRTVVADRSDSVSIVVELVEIPVGRAVVAEVSNAVSIGIQLRGVAEEGTVVAGVKDAIGIGILGPELRRRKHSEHQQRKRRDARNSGLMSCRAACHQTHSSPGVPMRYCHLDGLQGKAPADLSDPLPTGVFIQFAEFQYYRRGDSNFNLTGEKSLANSVSPSRIVNKRGPGGIQASSGRFFGKPSSPWGLRDSSSSGSVSSIISPTSSSSTSSRLTTPEVPPYSSRTTKRCCRLSWN